MKKLKLASPSMSELLEQNVLTELMDSLFPRNRSPDPIGRWDDFVWSDEWLVNPAEIERFVRKRPTSPKAPGPDGFRSVIWKRATDPGLNETSI